MVRLQSDGLQPLTDLQIGEGGNAVATVSPAMGPRELQRVTACLADATIDRVRGDVVIVDEPAV